LGYGDPKKDAAYYRDWYAKNRERIAAKKRERYQKDKAYRDAVIQRARDRAKKLTGSGEAQKGTVRSLVVDGVRRDVLTSTAVATMAGRTRRVIQAWEDAGWIPQPTLPGDHRCYTRGQAQLVRKVALALDKGLSGPEFEAVVAEVAEQWGSV